MALIKNGGTQTGVLDRIQKRKRGRDKGVLWRTVKGGGVADGASRVERSMRA